jgi:hypothetical protein
MAAPSRFPAFEQDEAYPLAPRGGLTSVNGPADAACDAAGSNPVAMRRIRRPMNDAVRYSTA